MFGCDVYGYGMAGGGSQQAETVYRLPAPEGCTKPHGTGAFAAVYFILVAVVGGLVLPTLLTAVITASTVHMGRNKEERSANAAKVDGVIALAPEYLHPTRVALLEELFENLDVSGDGSLAPDELQPAFTALSDEVRGSEGPQRGKCVSQWFLGPGGGEGCNKGSFARGARAERVRFSAVRYTWWCCVWCLRTPNRCCGTRTRSSSRSSSRWWTSRTTAWWTSPSFWASSAVSPRPWRCV